MSIGKWYILFHMGNFAFGFGRPSKAIRDQIDTTRRRFLLW